MAECFAGASLFKHSCDGGAEIFEAEVEGWWPEVRAARRKTGHEDENRLSRFREEPLPATVALEKYLQGCGLEPKLLELVKVCTSQINGCAYCIDMHSKDAPALGETEQRLDALNAWRETPFCSERERTALEWTEAVTRVSKTHVPHEVYESVRKHFSEKELLDLTFAVVVAINSWNRLAVSLRAVPGTYQPNTSFAAAC